MRYRLLVTWWLSLLWLLMVVLTAQAAPVYVPEQRPMLELATHVWVLPDPHDTLSVTEVAQPGAPFVPARRIDLVHSFNVGGFWLKLDLNNPTGMAMVRWLVIGDARLQHVTLFAHHDGRWVASYSGASVPARDKPVQASRAVFPLHLAPGASAIYLVRVKSQTTLDMVPSLWQPDAYRLHEGKTYVFDSLIVGAMLLGALASLIAMVLLRETPYLFFALLQLAAALLASTRNGLLMHYFWPVDWPFFSPLILISGAVALVGQVFLVVSFLDLRRHWPRARQWLFGVLAVSLLAMVLGVVWYGSGARLLSATVPVLLFSCLVITLKSWRSGQHLAKYLAIGFAPFWLIESLRQASNQGWVDMLWVRHFSLSLSLLVSTPLIALALIERSRTLAIQLDRLQQESVAKTAFLAKVSHELRSPLNLIIGYARMIGRGSPGITVPEAARDIERGGLRLQGLIGELLDQSSLIAGTLRLHPEPVHFSSWLAALERYARMQCEAVGNTFELVQTGALPTGIRIDPDRLWQVLDNLIENANRYTQNGAIIVRCRVAKGDRAGWVSLDFEVVDSGIGIAKDDQNRVFEPFMRIVRPNSRDQRRGGLGMGLPIVRELVRLMGGDVVLDSVPGRGSRFQFKLACESVALDSLPEPVVAPPVMPSQPAPSEDLVCETQLSEQALDSLRGLIVESEVSGIEAWLNEYQAIDAPFVAKLRERLWRLDFPAMETMVQAASHAKARPVTAPP